MENEYYDCLGKFESLCNDLIDKGGSYLVIVSNHELFRFLYPYEPVLDFINKDPVTFMVSKIQSLIHWLELSSKTIAFYSFDLAEKGRILSSSSSVEKKTSDVYTSLWNSFEKGTLTEESIALIKRRIPESDLQYIKGKKVLDMGCGSGRFSIALSLSGAGEVQGVDLFSQSYQKALGFVGEKGLKVQFREANFHHLPFEESSFDFVFCNGTIHHSTSIRKSLEEYFRVLKKGGLGFLYIYATGGFFWNTRLAMRRIFEKIPLEYTNAVLNDIGMPSNRFIFSDVWHVPIETHTGRNELELMLSEIGFAFNKVVSENPFDLDYALSQNIPGAEIVWGEGEHRYVLQK